MGAAALAACLSCALVLTGCVDQHPERVAREDGTYEPRIVATSPAVAEICDKLDLDLVGVPTTSRGLPERYAEHPELLEPVPECQSPIFLITEVEGSGREATARLFFSAPPEAPTTRGFASILAEALDGRTVGEVLDTPETVTGELGLAEVVSPLRLNGMAGMLARIKRQLAEKAGA